jgi:hypothetical protein
MDYSNDYENWKAVIEAVNPEEVKTISIPVDVICSEAETTVVDATQDKEKLIGGGLDFTLVEGLKSLSGATRYAQAHWMSEYQARQEVQKQWNQLAPGAYDLHAEMLHHLG